MYDFDVIVIGGGSAGFAAIDRAVDNDARTALVEAGTLGGDCPNRACVPTKIFVRAAEMLDTIEAAERLGIRVEGVHLDWPRLVEYKNEIVDALAGDRLEGVLKDRGVELLRGRPTFTSERHIELDGRTISAGAFILATGSRPNIPAIPGLEQTGFITSREACDLNILPKSLLIIGGGAVGLEFAQVFSRFGVEVIIVDADDRLVPGEDEEISNLAEVYAAGRRIDVRTGTRVELIGRNGSKKEARLRNRGGSHVVAVDEVMVAAGRCPNIEGLNLEAADVAFGPTGIAVDEYLRTSSADIWACGDVTGRQFYTHYAAYEGDLAGFNASSAEPEAIDASVVPHVIYAHPEIAAVGMTEAEAQRRCRNVVVGRMPYKYLGKSVIESTPNGLVKLVAAGDRVVGGHIIGRQAGELIHEIAVAMKNDMDIITLADTIHAYPTFSEGVGAAAADAVTAGGFAFEEAA